MRRDQAWRLCMLLVVQRFHHIRYLNALRSTRYVEAKRQECRRQQTTRRESMLIVIVVYICSEQERGREREKKTLTKRWRVLVHVCVWCTMRKCTCECAYDRVQSQRLVASCCHSQALACGIYTSHSSTQCHASHPACFSRCLLYVWHFPPFLFILLLLLHYLLRRRPHVCWCCCCCVCVCSVHVSLPEFVHVTAFQIELSSSTANAFTDCANG